MTELAYIFILTLGAGLCMPLGGALARIEHISPEWLETEFRHFMIAFGGGFLLGGVFVVLLPEGVSRFDNLSLGILVFMLLLTPIGPIAAITAHFLFRDQSVVLGAIMLLGAGGIMYIIFQDIAPQSRLKNHWAPPLGAIMGFAITLQADIWLNQT